MSKKIMNILDKFPAQKILVIGDIMLDKYVWGKVSRISPEAPVQIVLVENESFAPGGAANVANNVAELGGLVRIVGVKGEDSAGQSLIKELRRRSIVTDNIITDKSRPTVLKMRVLGHNQQLIRIDYEKTDVMSSDVIAGIKQAIEEGVKEVDSIIISDYAKGIMTQDIVKCIFENARKHDKPIIIDPKPKHKELYIGATVVLPNLGEARKMTGIEDENEETFEMLGKSLLEELKSNLIITRGEKGMSVFNKDGSVTHIPTKAREVYDVTGAGDTVTAALSLALSAGASLEDAAIVANHAAGVVVGKIGTSTATIGEIRESIQND